MSDDMQDDIFLWRRRRKELPLRPDDPHSLDERDPLYWYDEEYAGWMVSKRNQPPQPNVDPAGKLIRIFCPGNHPYWTAYEEGMRGEAERQGFRVVVAYGDWDTEKQQRQVVEGVAAGADCIVLIPVDRQAGTELLKEINRSGIPVIVSNQSLEPEAYSYIVAWTGPDDWGQHRLLARRFAERLEGRGGYCIVTHRPGTSAYLARSWGVISELSQHAPGMKLLDTAFTGFNREQTRIQVSEWLTRFGTGLKGIISADDALPVAGIRAALEEAGRTEIVCMANGATRRGLGFLKAGWLEAITCQSPRLDGALPLRVAADWFRGLSIDTITYLPTYLISRDEADLFLKEGRATEDVHCEELSRLVIEGNLPEIDAFFEDFTRRLSHERIAGEEYFRGVTIEILAELLGLARAKQVDLLRIVGGYEMLYKGLFQQRFIGRTLGWLQKLARSLVEEMIDSHQLHGSVVDQAVAHVELHYADPMSLKTLSQQFGLSAAYLGKLFREQTGLSFSRYLNEFRIEKAKELLRAGNCTAKEAGLAVGYADASYFYSIFKQICGLSPTEFCHGCGDG